MIKMRRSNLQSFCRTCLEHFQPKSASKFNINQTPNLTKLLIVCTSLNINEDADAVYPQNLCKKCYDTMQQFREFRDMAQQSDDVLRKIVVAEEEDKNIDTTNAFDEDGFFNDTSDSVNPEPEIKMEFEVEDMQENSIINKTVDAADDFANDSDSSAPTTSTAKKRKIHDETDKFLCKFYGCNAEFKTLQSLDDHIASQHATAQSTTAAQRTARRKTTEVKKIKASARSNTTEVKKMMASDYSSDFNTTTISDKGTDSFSDDDKEHPLLRKQMSPQEDLTQLSTMDMFKLVYESVNLNTTKMNSIINSQKELKKRLVDLEEGNTVRRHVVQGQFADIADNLENFLPLKTYEDFVIFEEKLNDKCFYDDTARYMKSLGGDTHHELVRGILDRFMSNCLALKFNMDGKFLKKKDGHGNDLTPKVPLTSSKFYKCIIKAAKLKNEDMDEKLLRSKTIGPWLSGATLRADRERKKKDRQQHRQHE